MNRLDISVTLNDGQTVSLVLFGQEGTLFEISQEEAQAYGESCCQLVEGKSYEYGIDAGYHLEGEVVYSSRLNESTGILQTGNQVGMLSVAVCRGEKWCGEVQLEVRSVKETYREDYRQMLEEITEHSTELLMYCNSPVCQYFEPSPSGDAQILYQRFAFIKSLIDSAEFANAIHQIFSSPVTCWDENKELRLALAMILANKLLKGIWKSIVVLGGILVGSMVYYSVMGFPETGGIQAGHEGYFGLWPWKFDLGAVLSFFFCFIALIVNELGSIQAVGRMIGADHMERRTTRGVGITGLANVVSGALGIVGPVDYSMSPGIIAATGCASRFPLIPAGIGLVVCAFFPGFIECLNAIPGVVMGAVLLYLMASQLSAGMQMMIREKAVDGFDGGLVVGFSLMVALLLSFAPDEALNSIPALIRPIVGNGFVMGVITVLILEHLIFRSGKKAKKE